MAPSAVRRTASCTFFFAAIAKRRAPGLKHRAPAAARDLLKLADGELEAFAGMPARSLGMAQPLMQRRELQMRRIQRLDGDARFEIVLGLAPQRLACA